jgi:hypothetical protein
MSDNTPPIPTKPSMPWKTLVIFGCFSISILTILACLSVVTIVYREKIPYVQNYFPTQTTTPPHIVIHPPDKDVKITSEDFSNNLNDWSTSYSLSKAEVKDGKLFLESFNNESFAISYCDNCSFVVKSNHSLQSPYYLQADFNTDHEANASYGLVFNIKRETPSYYYIFEINPTLKTYSLDKYQNNKWVYLSNGQSNLIRSYPETNTLSVDFEAGVINLYINGQAVTSATDKNPTDSGKIGVYVGDTGFKLIVDNLFAYHHK